MAKKTSSKAKKASKPPVKKALAKKPSKPQKKISSATRKSVPPKASVKKAAASPAVKVKRAAQKGKEIIPAQPRMLEKAPSRAITASQEVAVKAPVVPAETDSYQPKSIEPKWQKVWEEQGLYRSLIDRSKKKYYALTMLPYPSGNLHIGHWYAMTPSDARARFKRMQGFNVLFPIGFDAFGLPAENAAIQRGIHPKKWTYANIANMRNQLHSMGAMFDWKREAVSSDPEYYRWTQWFFVQFFRNKLAYKKLSPVDWCPKCNTTLAREQVWGEDRHCERCKTPVIKKNLDQWYFATTKYSEDLLDFDGIDWPEKVRDMQTNWIGRSEGAQVIFQSEAGDPIEIFTTRPDTLWGATFMVLAPEHPLVAKLVTTEQRTAVEEYVSWATRQTDIDRESTEKEKTGVFTGAFAINPVNGAKIPVWIADYVLMTYGTGAIMAVPAHDTRDFAFALKYGLAIQPVIARPDGLTKSFALAGTMRDGFAAALQDAGIPFEEKLGSLFVTIPQSKIPQYIDTARAFVNPNCWNEVVGTEWSFLFSDGIQKWDSAEAEEAILAKCKMLEPNVLEKRSIMEMLWGVEFYRDALYHDSYGTMIHSGDFSGTSGAEAKQKVGAWLKEIGKGQLTVTYRLRDWLISRQRYWGSPIPIIYCPVHGQQPVPEDQLPVLLPNDVEWKPTGESPLKLHPTWKKTVCPVCGGPAERDTDTMDTFMCSSWYHLRYLSPEYDKGPFDPEEYDYWMPVDGYTGGAEHSTMHLIYTRFFHKACRDLGITKGREPMLQLRNQGQILGPDGQRMSKSRGNVIDPDEQIRTYGADTVRAYLMFGYQWSEGGPWNTDNIQGVVRWLNRVWTLGTLLPKTRTPAGEADVRNLQRQMHQTIFKVTRDLEAYEFNTVVSSLMEYSNALAKYRDTELFGTDAWEEAMDRLLLLMAPVTPHIAEELWHRRKGKTAGSIHLQSWPKYDPALAAEENIVIAIQVNGKLRERIEMPVGSAEKDVSQKALAMEGVEKWLEGKPVKKIIYVPNKILNILV